MSLDLSLIRSALKPLALDDVSALADSLEHPARPAIRLRPGIVPADLPFRGEGVPWHKRGWYVAPEVRPGGFVAYAAADYYIQDAASLLAVALLRAQPGEMICDLCAAPGGKSTAILEDLAESGWLLANEAIQSRLGVLQLNLARHGSTRYLVACLDPTELAERAGAQFDAVLVDAPCSGQSLLTRGKPFAGAFSAQTIDHCAARQTRILDAAARLVRPGGRLVYATCTFAFAENEGRVQSFLASHDGWHLEPDAEFEPWQSEAGSGHYRLWPHRQGCGGAYAARLRRSPGNLPAVDRPDRDDKGILRTTAWPENSQPWGELRESLAFRSGLQVFAWPQSVPLDLVTLAQTGPEFAFRKGSTWFPSYALAMRRDDLWTPARQVVFDDDQARQYVQGSSLRGGERGWGVATWKRRALGWLKGDGSQMKNHLLKPARLVLSR